MVRGPWISWLGLSCLVVGGWYLGAPSASRRARADEPNKAQKYALLVGVREYKTPALRSLKYSERDIEDLAKVLLDAGFPEANLRILTQERAARGLRHLPTSDNIRTELDRMLKLVELADDPAATVIIALAGHGIMDPKAERCFFCPADTAAVNLSPDDPALIDLGALYDQLKASPAGFKLMLVDACRNDPLRPRRSIRPIAELVSVTRPFKKQCCQGLVVHLEANVHVESAKSRATLDDKVACRLPILTIGSGSPRSINYEICRVHYRA